MTDPGRDTEHQLGDTVTRLLTAVRDLVEAVLNKVAVLVAGESTKRRQLEVDVAQLRAVLTEHDARLAELERANLPPEDRRP